MPLTIAASARVFVARGVTDMRKSFDGLCSLVEHEFGRDPYQGDVFVFFNRRRTYVKQLIWDGNGFWLCAKRLEKGTFEEWHPSDDGDACIEIDRARLMMLLEGIDLKKSKFRRHFARSVRIGGQRERGEESDRGRQAQ